MTRLFTGSQVPTTMASNSDDKLDGFTLQRRGKLNALRCASSLCCRGGSAVNLTAR